jgi:hypothetical protein
LETPLLPELGYLLRVKSPTSNFDMSYQLTDNDSENGEKASFMPHDMLEDRSNGATKSPAWNTLSTLLKSSGIFMLGAICAVILVTSRDSFGQQGSYETGFNEEKLRKILELHLVREVSLHTEPSSFVRHSIGREKIHNSSGFPIGRHRIPRDIAGGNHVRRNTQSRNRPRMG